MRREALLGLNRDICRAIGMSLYVSDSVMRCMSQPEGVVHGRCGLVMCMKIDNYVMIWVGG